MTEKTRWLLTLCLVQLFIMMVFINYSAVLPQLKDEWGMNNTMAGSILSVYQLGYIASGVILSALTDRFNTRNIFIASALWSATANLLFAFYAHDYTSALVLRALTGIGMGGTYMPGIKLVAEKFGTNERGRAIGIFVGSLMLGASLSLAVTGWLSSAFGWRNAFVAGSVCVYLGSVLSLLVFRGYRPDFHARPVARRGVAAETLGNRSALLMILGYASHMWEMYGMRGWIAPFFTASLIAHGVARGVAPGWAATAAALVIGVGALSTALTGTLSDRLGTDPDHLPGHGRQRLLLLWLWLADQLPSGLFPGFWSGLRLPGFRRVAGLFHRADRTGEPRLPWCGHGDAVPDRLFPGHGLADGLRLGTGSHPRFEPLGRFFGGLGDSVRDGGAGRRGGTGLHVFVAAPARKRADGRGKEIALRTYRIRSALRLAPDVWFPPGRNDHNPRWSPAVPWRTGSHSGKADRAP